MGPEARLTIAEWGTQLEEPAILHTVEGFGALMRQLGIEGGIYWKWADAAAGNPMWAWNPEALIKVRGPGYRYHAVQREIASLYGLHLAEIPNGSFENGTVRWTVKGTARPLPLDERAPWRGATYVRLTGALIGARIRVSGSTAYTTSARLRGASATSTVRYIACSARKPKPQARVFRYVGTSTEFQAFPVTYTTPRGVCWVQIEVAAPGGIDVDEVT